MKLKIFFQNHSKVFIFDLEFEFRDLILMEKNTPHSLSMFITTSELCGFGIGFGIGRKYRPITVSVSVSGRNQNGGFGRSLITCPYSYESKVRQKSPDFDAN